MFHTKSLLLICGLAACLVVFLQDTRWRYRGDLEVLLQLRVERCKGQPRLTFFNGRGRMYDGPGVGDKGIIEGNSTTRGGFAMFEMRNSGVNCGDFTDPSILVLTLARDAESWGKSRTFREFLVMISGQGYPAGRTSLGILVSDILEYGRVTKEIRREFSGLGFASVRVFYRNGWDAKLARDVERRHDPFAQRSRRRALARLRNFLLYSALEDQDGVFWVDADVVYLDPGLLRKFVEADKDVLVPMTTYPDGKEYDLNSWAGPRKAPTAAERAAMRRGVYFVPESTTDTRFLGSMVNPSEFVELDSVGGTVLLVKADIHRQGVNFPIINLVGTEWEGEGYDGIETEGLCLLAKHLCYTCWGSPYDRAIHDAS